jgi:hypothetical protein
MDPAEIRRLESARRDPGVRVVTRLARGLNFTHHEDPQIVKLTVVEGGVRGDDDCVAWIESSVRHWITDASGAQIEGSQDVSHDQAYWRFARDPARLAG